MRLAIGLLVALSFGALGPVLAMEEPPAPQTTPEAAATATSAEQAPSKAATATTSSAPPDAARSEATATDSATKVSLSAGDEDAAAALKQLKVKGYKGEVHGSEIWFCRKETIVGSRFDKKVCFTADQLQHVAADAQQQTDRIQRRISGDPRTKNP
jgi:hypothetical protein